MSIIIGINCAFHESSAAIVKDGILITAVAEERFNRKKRGKKIRTDNPNEIPFNAIGYCLSKLEISYNNVDYWAVSFDPKLRLKNNLHWEEKDKKNPSRFMRDIKKAYPKEGFGTKKGEKLFHDKLMEIPDLLKEKGARINNKNFFFLPHHLCHAASSFYSSGFEHAAILILDAGGEYESSWLAEGEDSKINKIHGIDFPNSLGFLWIKVSEFCGLGYYGAGKLMGLASWGDPKKYMKEMENLIQITDNGFETNDERILAATEIFEGIEDLFKIKKNKEKLSTEHKDFQKYADIAASLQEITNKIVHYLVRRLKQLTRAENLCLAGGIFLNCHINQEVLDSKRFKEVFICPASADDGTSVGAALEISSRLGELKDKKIINWLLGKEYSNKEIEKALKKERVEYHKLKNIVEETAKLLNENNIVGWFQGCSEFGPRALGARSILANPLHPNKIRLNSEKVKDRENFRPVCPSVIEEDSNKYFSFGEIQQPHFNMLSTVNIKNNWIKKLPGISHPDNTARIQLVNKNQSKFYNLIKEFGKLSGIFMIINTSFNSKGEPIVNSPEDAIRTFKKCKGINYLIMGNFVIKKEA